MKKIISVRLLFLVLFFGIISCTTGPEKKTVTGFPAEYLEEMTIQRLQEEYSSGKLSVSKVVEDYLARIEMIDRSGPALNSVITINPDALKIAQELDSQLVSGSKKGPLFGVPVLIKDNIDTRDAMPNTAGSRALKNNFPQKDSPLVTKLRQAGAVILGKTNLSEWANFRSSASSSGWSGIGGQTRNPYILDRNPCGSSSGSGAAVSANLGLVAIGTETDGSIVCPSNNNGIVGLKPTVGLISRTGIIPISYNQDTPGPMGRTVSDVAALLGPLTGIDSSDTKTLSSAGKSYSDYSAYLKKDGLRGKRIGLLKSEMGFSARVDTIIMEAVRKMRDAGADIVILDDLIKNTGSDSFTVLLYEFRDGINRYLSGVKAKGLPASLKELIDFNLKDSVELRYFDQKIFLQAEDRTDINSKEYRDALIRIQKATREEGIDRLTVKYKLDALMEPTGSPAWKTDLVLGDHFVGGSSSLAAIAGYPSITVPAGFVDELPVGVSFTGRAWSEPLLIEIAYSFEQATMKRKAPRFISGD